MDAIKWHAHISHHHFCTSTGVSTYSICAPHTVDTSSNARVTCGISAAVYTLNTCREDSHSKKKNMDTECSYTHTPWCTIPTPPPPPNTYLLLSSIHLYIQTAQHSHWSLTTSLGNGHGRGSCHMCEKHGKEIAPLIQGSLTSLHGTLAVHVHDITRSSHTAVLHIWHNHTPFFITASDVCRAKMWLLSSTHTNSHQWSHYSSIETQRKKLVFFHTSWNMANTAWN